MPYRSPVTSGIRVTGFNLSRKIVKRNKVGRSVGDSFQTSLFPLQFTRRKKKLSELTLRFFQKLWLSVKELQNIFLLHATLSHNYYFFAGLPPFCRNCINQPVPRAWCRLRMGKMCVKKWKEKKDRFLSYVASSSLAFFGQSMLKVLSMTSFTTELMENCY